MNSFLRQFISCFIWSRGLRHAVKNNLVKHYFKAKKHFNKYFKQEEKLKFRHNLSIVLIIKDEASYLQEWIEYHKLVGIDKFYIYDNESSDNIKEILKPYIKSKIVEYIFWPGKLQQKPAYNDAITKYKLDTKWMAFIDTDEFIVPISKKTIPEIINEIKPKYGLSIHWCHYGDNNHKVRTNGLVIERFTKRSYDNFGLNTIVKSIINPRAVYYMEPHNACFIGNRSSIDENGSKVTGSCSHNIKDISMNKIRINHYYCKSWAEYENKIKRGDVNRIVPLLYRSTFDGANRNDIEDPIMKKYVRIIKQKIKNDKN